MGERRIARLDFDASATGKMRNEITVRSGFGGPWDFATDEGPFHGGDSTAPPPLAYFTTSLASCFMTQFRAFAKRAGVTFESLHANGWAEWWLELDGRNPYTSGPMSFGVDIEISSEASTEELVDLVRAAQGGCFVEQTVVNAASVQHALVHNGIRVEVTE